MNVQIKKIKLTSVKLNPNNPRKANRAHMERLVLSLRQFPEMMSIREIVVDENYVVLGGNMRVMAMREAGEDQCLAKIVSGLTEDQKKEFMIKDNAAFGEWDMEVLANIWSDVPLNDWGVRIGFIPADDVEIPDGNKEIDEAAMEITSHECQFCGFKW